MLSRPLTILIALSALSLIASAQSSAASDARKKVIVESVVISGTQSLSSGELAEITDSLTGGKFNDDPDELTQRIQRKFSDRGYILAQVDKLDVKVLDPVASPKLVRLEATVTEGTLCHLSNTEFTGNHAIDSETLRAAFSIKNGQTLHLSSIENGLETVRTLYGTQGFLDVIMIPAVKIDSGSSAKLNVEVREGAQYKMDEFEVVGPEEAGQRLRMRWELASGAVYDASYLEKFLENNRSLLPADFTRDSGVQVLANCPDATVSIHIHLNHYVQHEVADQAKRVPCKSNESDAE